MSNTIKTAWTHILVPKENLDDEMDYSGYRITQHTAQKEEPEGRSLDDINKAALNYYMEKYPKMYKVMSYAYFFAGTDWRNYIQPEEPKEGEKTYTAAEVEKIMVKFREQGDAYRRLHHKHYSSGEWANNVLIERQTKEIADLKSQIATLKAAETFSRGQMIGFAEWIYENNWYIVHEGMHANEWSKRGFGVYKPTTDLLNEFLKQKP